MYPQTTAGAQVGGYEILSRLAVGGMAELFLARARRALGFEKLVVLKRILPSLAHDPTFAAMFFDEARIAASLDHPNLIHVFDIDESAGTHYIAMEYVHGVDLRRLNSTLWSRGDRLPFDVALTIGIGIAAGLHYAHERLDSDGRPLGLIHRDVSPSNVLLGFEGAIKVTDFGIAKATSRQAQTGSLKGKVLYMSPEQCNGGYLDRRSDVFALGTVLYEMTTGYRPFDAPAMVQLLRAIAEDDVVAPSSLRPDYPPALETVVLRALTKNPDDRFPTAAHVQWALEEVARQHGYAVTAGTLGRYLGATLVESRMSPLELCAHLEQATGVPGTQSDVPVHEGSIENDEATSRQRSPGLPGTPRQFAGPLPARESTATADARLIGAATPASSPTPLPSPLGNQVTVTIPGEGVSRVPPRRSRGLAIFAVIMVMALLGGAGAAFYVLDRSSSPAAGPVPARPTQAAEAAPPPAAATPAAPVAGAAVETSARPGSDVDPAPPGPAASSPAGEPEPAAAETAAAETAAAEAPSPARERDRKRGRKRTPSSADGPGANPPEKPGWDLNSPFPPGE